MAIESMTGFGQARVVRGAVEIRVEVRSVNHRYLDLSFKLPPMYSQFESKLGKILREGFNRGHIDIYVSRSWVKDPTYEVRFNAPLFRAYQSAVKKALGTVKVSGEMLSQATLDILRRKEVLDVVLPESDSEDEEAALEKALRQATDDLAKMRSVEGKALGAELTRLLDIFEKNLREMKARAADAPEEFRERLSKRLKKLANEIQVEPSRLAQEVALLAERADVTEELSRLQSHIGQFRGVMKGEGGGRKLEFILQEMGREVNTIGSKSQNQNISNLVIEAKALLEKLREQVLNVE